MPEIKLKPCPFCGGKADVFHWQAHINDDTRYNLMCTKCGAGFYDFSPEKRSETFEKWNRRAPNEH